MAVKMLSIAAVYFRALNLINLISDTERSGIVVEQEEDGIGFFTVSPQDKTRECRDHVYIENREPFLSTFNFRAASYQTPSRIVLDPETIPGTPGVRREYTLDWTHTDLYSQSHIRGSLETPVHLLACLWEETGNQRTRRNRHGRGENADRQ